MRVVDASALAAALLVRGDEGDAARSALAGTHLAAPELIDVEVASVIRRHVMAKRLDAPRAEQVLVDLLALPLRRAPHRPLLGRCWELRANLTIYDASYVALAEHLDTVLVTADARLAGAPGLRCRVHLVAAA